MIRRRVDRWAATSPFPPHRTTTRQLRAIQPMTATNLGARGPVIGINLADGTAWCYDPWELYGPVITDANAVVLGALGQGKSALIKAYCRRQARVFGRRVVVVSPKPGEYDAFAATCGITPLRLRPGGRLRLNPLDTVDVDAGDGDARSQRLALLTRLCEAALGREAVPAERNAMAVAIDDLAGGDVMVLPQVVDRMLSPSEAMAADSYVPVGRLAREGRDAALALRDLVTGRLAGMFDGPTSPGVDLTADAVVLDLSALQTASPQAMGMALICFSATATGQLARAADAGTKTILVLEEAWAALQDVAMARWFRAQTKLSRALGLANMFVLHRLGDLEALGGGDAEQVKIARNLIADCGTRILFRQDPDEFDRLSRVFRLSSTQRAAVADLRRGQSLWLVGSSTSTARVQLMLTPWERDVLTYTDAAMAVATSAVRGLPAGDPPDGEGVDR